LRRALGDRRPEVRFQAIIAFARVAPDETDDALFVALDDEDANVRHIAIRCAEERALETNRPIPEALRAKVLAKLDDADATVRLAAAILLARAGEPRVDSVLIDIVRGAVSTREAEDEAAAIELCGERALSEAAPHLERRAFGVLGFGADRFAWQALVSLAKMGHPRARAKIVRDLGSWWRDRRTLAVAAAGRAGLAEARPLIEAMRGDERRADADTVASTLDRLAHTGAAP
jgi:hypothetical protein